MVRQMKAKPKPTTRSLFCQPELDEESETEFQSSDFDFPSTQAVKNVMQEVLLFSELSLSEQRAQIESEPPVEIEERCFLFYDGIQYQVRGKDFSPAEREDFVDNSSSSSSSSSSAFSLTAIRPPSNIAGSQLLPVGE